jgi:hypothetical protein
MYRPPIPICPEHVRDPRTAYSDLPKGPTPAVCPKHVRDPRKARSAEVQEVPFDSCRFLQYETILAHVPNETVSDATPS